MYAEDIILLMIVILVLLFVFYSISSNRGELEDEYIDREVIMTERKIAGTETKISDLQRQRDNAATITEKRRLDRELLRTEQEKLRTEVDRNRVFDQELVKEIKEEMEVRDAKDLEELNKREKEYQNELNELTSTLDVEKDLSKTNRISALMSKQKNIQSIRNKKIGYASEKSRKIEDAVNGLKTMKTTYDEELVELNKDLEKQKNVLNKGRYLSDDEKSVAEAEKTRLEKAIKLIEEDRELGDRKIKILNQGRIDNLETINSYNKGATVLRTEAVANDGIMRLIQQKRLQKGATKADREVAIKAENLVKERDINQEVLELGLALHRSKEDGDKLEDRWKDIQNNRKEDLELGRESRLIDEYKKQEVRDILAEEKTKTKVKTSLDKLAKDGDYGFDTDLGSQIDTALGNANYENTLEGIITAQEAKVDSKITSASGEKKRKLKEGKKEMRKGIENLIQKRKNLIENNRQLFDARKKLNGLDGVTIRTRVGNSSEEFYANLGTSTGVLSQLDTDIENAKVESQKESYKAIEKAINGSYTNDPLVESSIKRALKRNASSDLPSKSGEKNVITLKTAVKERKDNLRRIEEYALLDEERLIREKGGEKLSDYYEKISDKLSLILPDKTRKKYLQKIKRLGEIETELNKTTISLEDKERLEKEKLELEGEKEKIEELVRKDRESRGFRLSENIDVIRNRLKEVYGKLKDPNVSGIERQKLNAERIDLEAKGEELRGKAETAAKEELKGLLEESNDYLTKPDADITLQELTGQIKKAEEFKESSEKGKFNIGFTDLNTTIKDLKDRKGKLEQKIKEEKGKVERYVKQAKDQLNNKNTITDIDNFIRELKSVVDSASKVRVETTELTEQIDDYIKKKDLLEQMENIVTNDTSDTSEQLQLLADANKLKGEIDDSGITINTTNLDTKIDALKASLKTNLRNILDAAVAAAQRVLDNPFSSLEDLQTAIKEAEKKESEIDNIDSSFNRSDLTTKIDDLKASLGGKLGDILKAAVDAAQRVLDKTGATLDDLQTAIEGAEKKEREINVIDSSFDTSDLTAKITALKASLGGKLGGILKAAVDVAQRVLGKTDATLDDLQTAIKESEEKEREINVIDSSFDTSSLTAKIATLKEKKEAEEKKKKEAEEKKKKKAEEKKKKKEKKKKNETDFLEASDTGNVGEVKRLLDEGNVDVNAKDGEGSTALMYAANKGHINIINMILEKEGVKINAKDGEGNTALMVAVVGGKLGAVKRLLETKDIKINETNNKGQTALDIADALLNVSEEDKNKIKTSLIGAGAKRRIGAGGGGSDTGETSFRINDDVKYKYKYEGKSREAIGTIIQVLDGGKKYKIKRTDGKEKNVDKNQIELLTGDDKSNFQKLKELNLQKDNWVVYRRKIAGEQKYVFDEINKVTISGTIIMKLHKITPKRGKVIEIENKIRLIEILDSKIEKAVNQGDAEKKAKRKNRGISGSGTGGSGTGGGGSGGGGTGGGGTGGTVSQESIDLYNAVVDDQIDRVRQILATGGANIDVTNPDNGNSTPLIVAAEKGNLEMVELLVDKGADTDKSKTAEDRNKKTALDYADESNNLDMVKLLVDKGKFAKNYLSKKLNEYVKKANYGDIVKILIEKGADVNKEGIDEKTPLINAVEASNTDIVKILIEKGAVVNKEDTSGKTALDYAQQLSDSDKKVGITKLLEDKTSASSGTGGGDVNAQLLDAVENGNKEGVTALLSKGADVNAKDTSGKTALMHAAEKDELDIVTALIGAKADVDAKDTSGKTALMFAAEKDNLGIVSTLIGAKADVDAVDKTGKKAYRYSKSENVQKLLKSSFDKLDAEIKGSGNLVKVNELIPKVKDINKENNMNVTLLELAITKAENNKLEIVKALIDAGANVNKESYGHTPLELAITKAKKNKLEIVKALIEAGADVNKKSHGNTPLDSAKGLEDSDEKTKIIQFLEEKGGKPLATKEDTGESTAASPIKHKSKKSPLQKLKTSLKKKKEKLEKLKKKSKKEEKKKKSKKK